LVYSILQSGFLPGEKSSTDMPTGERIAGKAIIKMFTP